MSTFNLAAVVNRATVSVGDTVQVDQNKSFTVQSASFSININGEPDVLFSIAWKNGDASGVDVVAAHQLKNLLV
jgi:hypothetical protein